MSNKVLGTERDAEVANIALAVKGRSTTQLLTPTILALIMWLASCADLNLNFKLFAADAEQGSASVHSISAEDQCLAMREDLSRYVLTALYVLVPVSIDFVSRNIRHFAFSNLMNKMVPSAEHGDYGDSSTRLQVVQLVMGIALLCVASGIAVGVEGKLNKTNVLASVGCIAGPMVYMCMVWHDRANADEVRRMHITVGEKRRIALAMLESPIWLVGIQGTLWCIMSYLNWGVALSISQAMKNESEQMLSYIIVMGFFIGAIVVVMLLSIGLRDSNLSTIIRTHFPGALAPKNNIVVLFLGIAILLLMLGVLPYVHSIIQRDLTLFIFLEGIMTAIVAMSVRDRMDAYTIERLYYHNDHKSQ